eukprot:SM000869S23002  [mRNA]  locus=s869:1:977:- [translate_table: standard]
MPFLPPNFLPTLRSNDPPEPSGGDVRMSVLTTSACSFAHLTSSKPSSRCSHSAGTVNFTQVGSLKRYPPVGGITAPNKAINHPVLFPLIEYAHRDFNPASSSIIQGPIYRGPLSCYYGKMFWNECFNCVNMMQVATDTTPPAVGKRWQKASSQPVSQFCSSTSPYVCGFGNKTAPAYGQLTQLSWLWIWAEDNSDDAYVVSRFGVYRLVHPAYCNLTAACGTVPSHPPPSPSPPPPRPP